jgi:glycosyltransferase involved in cell wall biosynthesis
VNVEIDITVGAGQSDVNVAFVSNVVYPFVKGGAEKRIHEIGKRLVGDGHEVTVYGRHFWDGPELIVQDGMTLQAVAPSAELYEGERRSITEAIDFSVRLLRPLRTALDQRDHDVVVASVFPYFPVLSSRLASVGRDTPLVTTWHEVWRSYWKEYLGRLWPFGAGVEAVTGRTPQYPVAISDVTASRLAEIGPKREEIEVVPNGIDVEQVRTAPIPNDGYDVLFAGRLIEHKNVDVLLSAFDKVATERDIRLGIIGDGPEAAALKEQAAALDAADRIDFLGFLEDYEDVLGHMRTAEVFASPSTREGFGITFIEAMAADCKVIAADHPNSAASSVVGEHGWLVPPTVGGVAEALTEALTTNGGRGDPVARAEQYDWDQVAVRAEEVYERAATGQW